MRKYTSTGNIFPVKKEINFLSLGGNLYPPKYITKNTNKETHKSLRASEDTRIKNNLTIVFDYISFASLLKKALYKYLKSKLIFQILIWHIRIQIYHNLKPNLLIRFRQGVNDSSSNIYWNLVRIIGSLFNTIRYLLLNIE